MPFQDTSERIPVSDFSPNKPLRVASSIAGRKLLLADDSLAIQKVIDLTFTDEGMEVATVGDGQDALDKLDQFTPDVVLADVFMPGVDGYELCKFIKQSERFRGVPVMLLIGTFEPFDEAEAKRAGADDVVTKPFQSIRQLVSRVGSLLSDEEAAKRETAQGYSMLGLNQTEGSGQPVEPARQESELNLRCSSVVGAEDEQANVRVFVEAPRVDAENTAEQEHHYPPDIELQTADTQKLEPIDGVIEMSEADIQVEDTIEIEAVADPEQSAGEFSATAADRTALNSSEPVASHEPTRVSAAQSFDDGVLDLGDVDSFASAPADDDFILDLDGESVITPNEWAPVTAEAPTQFDQTVPTETFDEPAAEMTAEVPSTERQQWSIVDQVSEPDAKEEEKIAAAPASEANAVNLSPEAIEAISRRVVEQLSDKVVREIAWEVVPELSELLIKKRLDEQK